MASAVPHAVLRKLCQGVLCCLNIVHFHGTRMNVIMWTTMENMTFLAPLYANLQMVNNIMIKSLTSKISQVGEQTWKKPRNSFTPLNKLWFSRNSQSLRVCARLLSRSFTDREKKLKNEFRCTEFDPNRTKSIENTGKNIICAYNWSMVSTLPILTNSIISVSYRVKHFPCGIIPNSLKKYENYECICSCALRKSMTVTI
jgi:hypothetical protein